MKFTTKTLAVFAVVALTTLLLSWNKFAFPITGNNAANKLAIHHWNENENLSDQELSALEANADWYSYTDKGDKKRLPSAEDVLVQRIPGDNNHLLIMAFYSKESFKESSVVIGDDENRIELKDNGIGDDKKAGDGIYTAKIYADVADFRKQAVKMALEQKKTGASYKFVNRMITADADAAEPFNAAKFDAFQPVSIAATGAVLNSELIDSVRRNCIFITDLNVVEDPTRTWNPCTQTGVVNGPWTFGEIFRQLASTSPQNIATDAELSDFIKIWLTNFAVRRIINGDTVNPRPLVLDKILNPWIAKSEAAGGPAGQLDMRFAPFKLTAILNRFDLRDRFAGIPAGESRFTFCLINADCTDKENFTMVVEYSIPKPNKCDSLHSWADQWFNLKNYDLGTPAYNAALQNITDQFSKSGSNRNKTNESSLSTVRTNDRALILGDTAEFREFRLNSITGNFIETTCAQIPADKFNGRGVGNPDVATMVLYVNQERKNIVKDNYTVPDTFNSVPFVAGAAHILAEPVGSTNLWFWDGTEQRNTPYFIKNTTARHVFSLNTCTGCHAGEMQTHYTHVDPVFFGTETSLSGFLSGRAGANGDIDFDFIPENDSFMMRDAALRPASNPTLRMFNDILRRARDLKDFSITTCTTPFAIRNQLMYQPTSMVH
jgi:hypothetical protein